LNFHDEQETNKQKNSLLIGTIKKEEISGILIFARGEHVLKAVCAITCARILFMLMAHFVKLNHFRNFQCAS
jgi:hypothetical protein